MLTGSTPGDRPCQERPQQPGVTTVEALLLSATRDLHEAGIEEPRREARWLLGHLLHMTESSLLAWPDTPILDVQAERVRRAVRRRAAHEPFAYVVGSRDLYGRTFAIDRRVLVPRPETETLIEEALTVLRAREHDASTPPLAVDVGTGSGAIACTLALEARSATVVGCDVSGDAVSLATTNRDRLKLRRRLHLVNGDLLTWLGEPVDLVVANLPYIPTARIPALMPEVADWEPRLALDGGPDGLDLVRALLADAPRAVRPGGTILLELDPEQMRPASRLLPGARSRVIQDLAGLDRVLRLDVP